MQLITPDVVDFLPVPDLQIVVFRAIEAQANQDCPHDPFRAAQYARDRKMIVLSAMNDLSDYPQDQRAMLLGFWEYFGGGAK